MDTHSRLLQLLALPLAMDIWLRLSGILCSNCKERPRLQRTPTLPKTYQWQLTPDQGTCNLAWLRLPAMSDDGNGRPTVTVKNNFASVWPVGMDVWLGLPRTFWPGLASTGKEVPRLWGTLCPCSKGSNMFEAWLILPRACSLAQVLKHRVFQEHLALPKS